MNTAAATPNWAQPIAFNARKLEELVVYVATKCEHHNLFGAIKLNKILFFSDFLSFLRLGQPITGDEYTKLERGPAPRHVMPTRNRLLRDGAIEEVRGGTPLRPSTRVRAKRQADTSVFTAEQLSIVDEVIAELQDMTAEDVSLMTHDMAGWQLTEMGERIPYTSIFIPDQPLDVTPAEVAAAKAIVQRLSVSAA